ncbi:MAG: 3-phosphoserine/phosphohydroxythreonine transaminase [Epsilonproteobacteria bacterium]|nr:3-phosphoserine/phosphohydroxythreonine transaminase [Campylobacterota bacterium]
MNRVFNFGAGPSAIPLEVLEEAQKNLVDYKGEGLSIMEASHRSKMYDEVHNEAISLMKELYKIPEDYDVLLLQGGASLQFAMVPLNLYRGGKVQYVDSGSWSSKAIKEAKVQNLNMEVIASSKETTYDRIPADIAFDDDADYAYITSNNTIYGTGYKSFPDTKAPLVVDASSDIFSYPVDWSKVDLMFAGAQKNAGPSGLTIVIIKKELLDRAEDSVPTILKYKTHAEKDSLYHTPPTFGIYLLSLIMKWLKENGGIEAIAEKNEEKAGVLYDAIDKSNGFYVGHAQKESRSLMNVSFNIKDANGENNAELEAKFVALATGKGLIGLKGHRSIGGLRASIYNAMSLEGVQALVDLMELFQKENS